MAQAWLQVAGLVLDVLGFALIAWEWMLAQKSERAILALEASQARAAEGRAHLARSADPSMQRHLEAVAEMDRRRTGHGIADTRTSFGRRRHGAVYVGMAAVLAGFVLQLLGAWPGCCSGIGIVPAG